MNLSKNSRILLTLQLILTVLWLTNLINGEAYFSVYCLCGCGSLYCAFVNGTRPFSKGKWAYLGAILFSLLLSLGVVLANYRVFEIVRDPNVVSAGANKIMNLLEGFTTFLSGCLVFYQIVKYFVERVSRQETENRQERNRPLAVSFLTAGIILAIDLIYLFFVVYPGNLSHDTMHQISQIKNGTYNNFTPFWHTQLIRLCLFMGEGIFGSINAGAALFCVFQSLMMAGTFGYAMMTLYEMQVPKPWLILSFCLYVFLPVHIVYSASIWKDVPFGVAFLLVTTAMLRILKKTGKRPGIDRVMLTAGGILLCMARTNGFYVMLISFLLLLLVMRKDMKSCLLPWVLIVAVGWVLNGPVLSYMHIEHIKKVETISLPIQQIGKVVAENGVISQENLDMIDLVMPVEQIREDFWDITADPMKDLINQTDPQYFFDHQQDYRKLWLRLGADNPELYLKAWIDLTKGYWNGGYDYYIYAEYIADNSFGIIRTVSPNPVFRLVKAAFALTRETIFFEPICSIGLMVWLTWLSFYLNLIEKRKETVLYIPLLVVVIGLWLGAPVYSEFRYVYPLFTVFPLLFPTMLYYHKTE